MHTDHRYTLLQSHYLYFVHIALDLPFPSRLYRVGLVQVESKLCYRFRSRQGG